MNEHPFSSYVALGLILELEILAQENNCVLWIRNKEYNKQLYVSSNYQNLWGRSCLSLYQHPESWKDTLDEKDAEIFVAKLIKKRQLINPHYTALLCVKTPNGERRWFQDRSFHLSISGEDKSLVVGCALYVGDKEEIISEQNVSSDILDTVISRFYQILSLSIPQYKKIEIKKNSLLEQLTTREMEVVKLFLNGYTITQAAEVLSLSPRTIESYLTTLKGKLNCDSKSEIILTAIENQWIIINI